MGQTFCSANWVQFCIAPGAFIRRNTVHVSVNPLRLDNSEIVLPLKSFVTCIDKQHMLAKKIMKCQ